WIFIVLFLNAFVFGLIGNFLVCYVIWKNNHLRTVTNSFLMNLAVADFMVILICLPPTLTHHITESWFLGGAMCKIVGYIQDVSVLVSVLTLTAISVERYLAICNPLSFREIQFKTNFAIIVIWAISMIVSLPNLVFLTLVPDEIIPSSLSPLLTSCKPSNSERELQYQIFLVAVFYILPIYVMAFNYVKIGRCLWISTTTGTVAYAIGTDLQPGHLLSRRRTARMLIVVVVVFILSYLPVYLLNILRYVGVLGAIKNDDATVAIALTSHFLCYFNSAMNPVIYNFMSGKFRKEFRTACVWCTRMTNKRKEGITPETNSLNMRRYNSCQLFMSRSAACPYRIQFGKISISDFPDFF
ncbi:hypothetical protein ScPMuIL_001547, partial [Solemya velum]